MGYTVDIELEKKIDISNYFVLRCVMISVNIYCTVLNYSCTFIVNKTLYKRYHRSLTTSSVCLFEVL